MKFSSPLEETPFQKFKKDIKVNSERDERQRTPCPQSFKRENDS